MAEVLTFSEGSAYAWTGGAASSLLSYVRNVNINANITYQKYKPPHATVYTNYPIASAAHLSITQARVHQSALKLFMGVSAGGFHFHAFQSAPNIGNSGGCFLYSGNLMTLTIAEQTDSEVTLSFDAEFPTWSAY